MALNFHIEQDNFNSQSDFAQAVVEGLQSVPKSIPSKYLYDDRGSQLFAQITQLKEYYLTGSELEILQNHSKHIMESLSISVNRVVELGPGDGKKSEVFLKQFIPLRPKLIYVPVDISAEAVKSTTEKLSHSIPQLEIDGFVGDYAQYLRLNQHDIEGRLFLLLGSSIGNYTLEEAVRFLSLLGSFLTEKDYLLIGFDLKKDQKLMEQAYNDDAGITAEFNFNLLNRINRELGANFNRDNFYHHEFYNPHMGAMQSYLIAKIPHNVVIPSLDLTIHFDQLEGIHIEDSFKYTPTQISQIATSSNFKILQNYQDHQAFFIDSLWQKSQ